MGKITRVTIKEARTHITTLYQSGLINIDESTRKHRRLSEIQASDSRWSHKKRLYAIISNLV